MTATVTVIGLGPAGTELSNKEALLAIANHTYRFAHVSDVSEYPVYKILGSDVVVFDHCKKLENTCFAASKRIVEDVIEAALKYERVLYAVPGSPMVAEPTVQQLISDERVKTLVISGVSFTELVWSKLGIDPAAEGVRIVDACRLIEQPTLIEGSVLILGVDTPDLFREVSLLLESRVDEVTVLQRLGTDTERIESVTCDNLLSKFTPDSFTTFYLSCSTSSVAFEIQSFVDLVAFLRSECPWDSQQTHSSLKPYLLEEAYEVLETLDELNEDTGDGFQALEEELGDLLFQIAFHAQIAADNQMFDLVDVVRGICEKLRKRHPHVFSLNNSDEEIDTSRLLEQWEKIKREEKKRVSVLDGIPRVLPSLLTAQKIVRRAESIGITLSNEKKSVLLIPESEQGFGDTLMSIVDWGRELGYDAENSLRSAIARFSLVIQAVERLADQKGIDLITANEKIRSQVFAEALSSSDLRETFGRGG